MSNSVFPALPGLEWNSTKSPSWNTSIQRSVGGRETRISFMSLPIWRWTLSYEFLRQADAYAEFQTLVNFFNARQGNYDSFLYTDPTDYLIADTSPSTRQNFGTGNGSTTAFQLVRSLVASGVNEPIYNVNGTAKIYKANVLQTVGVDYTINSAGLVTFSSAPASSVALTWSGSYYWRVRFEQASSEYSLFASQYWQARQVSLISILGS
jgi:uncharacterized protein (TIGR02217 family)